MASSLGTDAESDGGRLGIEMVTRRIDIIDHSDFPHAEMQGESESYDVGFEASDFLFLVDSDALDFAAAGSVFDHSQVQLREHEGAFDDDGQFALFQVTSIGDLADSFYLRYGEIRQTDIETPVDDEGLEDFARRAVSLKLHDGSGE